MSSHTMGGMNMDREYALGMIHHHESAIQMAQAEVDHGSNAELKKMAGMMITDQRKEIAELKAWMADHK